MKEKEWVSVKTLAAAMDVKEGTVRSWVRKRQISFQKFNRLVRFDSDTIRAWGVARTTKAINPI